MLKKINSTSLLVLIGLITLFKVFYAWNVDFYSDELMVTSKGYWDWLSIIKYSLYNSYHPPLTYLIPKLLNHLNLLTLNKLRLINIIISTIPIIYFLINIKRNSLYKYLLLLTVFNAYVFSFSLLVTNYTLAYSLLLIFLTQYFQNKSLTSILWLAGLIFFTNYLAGLVCLLLIFLRCFKYDSYKELFYYIYLNIPFFLGILFFYIMQYYKAPFETYSQIFLGFSAIIFLQNKVDIKGIIKLAILFLLIVKTNELTYRFNISEQFNYVMLTSQLLMIWFISIRSEWIRVPHLLTIAILQFITFYFNELGIDFYVILSGVFFYAMLFIFKRSYFNLKYLPLQIIIFWLTQKTLYNINVYEKLSHFYRHVPDHIVPFAKTSPYIILITLCLFSIYLLKEKSLKVLKENQALMNIVFTFFINVCLFLCLHLYGRTIYMRYLIFVTPLLIFIGAFYINKNKNPKHKTMLLSFYIIANLFFPPESLSYLKLNQTKDLFNKITKNGEYAGSIILFTANYSWHKYNFNHFRILDNFKLDTFKYCDPNSIKKALEMSGRNTFIAAYDFECPDFKQDVMKQCENYDSKCYDLGAKDATVILKVFEPETQESIINELDYKYILMPSKR